MNTTRKNKFQAPRLHALVAASALAIGLCLAATTANATPITISAAVGGVPTGNYYENFDSLTNHDTSTTLLPSGITVSFTPDGQAVQGSANSLYAAPYLSNSNGTLFGDPGNAQDTTTYLTSGAETIAHNNAAVTLLFPTAEHYMGLLWGSVDLYNTLSFYNGNSTAPFAVIGGGDIYGAATGDQGPAGTYYVNINSSMAFDKVVATSSQYAFEFDNVAFDAVSVPEPGTVGIFLLGLALIGSGYWFRKRKLI